MIRSNAISQPPVRARFALLDRAATAIVGIGFLIVLIEEVLNCRRLLVNSGGWPTATAASSFYRHALKKSDEQ